MNLMNSPVIRPRPCCAAAALKVLLLGLTWLGQTFVQPAQAQTPPDALDFAFTSAANQTASLSIAGDGAKTIVVSDRDAVTALTWVVTGRADEQEISLSISAERDAILTLTYATGESVEIQLCAQPTGAEVELNINDGSFSTAVRAPSDDRVSLAVELTAVDAAAVLSIIYDDLPAEEEETVESAERITPRFPGFLNGEALGGSVTLSATGMTSGGVAIVTLFYVDADATQVTESEIRVHRFENTTGAFEPVGDNHRGVGEASETLGDYGSDPDGNAAWGVVDRLGTFAVGVTDDTLPAVIETDDSDADGLGGTNRGICGAVGVVGLASLFLGLVALRFSSRT